jgi:hypothetical protein
MWITKASYSMKGRKGTVFGQIMMLAILTSACSENASLGQNLDSQTSTGGVSVIGNGGAPSSSRNDSSETGGARVAGGAGSVLGTTEVGAHESSGGSRALQTTSATTAALDNVGGQAGARYGTPTGGTTFSVGTTASNGGTGISGATTATSPNMAGAAGIGCEHTTGVELTSSVAMGPSGKAEIVGRWCNGTSQSIFLSGCTTVQGEYLEPGGVWQNHGGFMQCTWEGYARELEPGQSLLDGGTPPNRGTGVWRLVGSYGVGCTSGQPLSQANCAQSFNATSNQVTFP